MPDTPFVAELMLFAGNFAPRGWAFCDGQLLAISQNTALFSLLGTNYGGNGTTTFALPDLRSRAPVHAGQGPGLTPRSVGETGGEDTVSLNGSQSTGHGHGAQGVRLAASQALASPAGNAPASGANRYSPNATTTMAANAATDAGSGAPHENMPPYLGVTYCIALQGIFPARN
jgi:microcystin-dependent protein